MKGADTMSTNTTPIPDEIMNDPELLSLLIKFLEAPKDVQDAVFSMIEEDSKRNNKG